MSAPFNIDGWRARAKRRLPSVVFDYLEGGAEDEATLRANREAFRRYRFVPDLLPGSPVSSTAVDWFGEQLAVPFVVGPTGLNGIFWPDADLALAKAAHGAGAAFALSSASNVSIEAAAAAAAASNGPRWFQLYPWGDRGLSERLMERARAAGYTTLIVTVDALLSGKRERDLRNGFAHELRTTPRSVWQGMTRPRWLFSTWLPHGMPGFENLREFAGPRATPAQLAAFVRDRKNPSFAWDDVAYFRQRWDGPLAVKGVLCEGDAKRAQQIGADAIVVSNHGGRQLDGAIDTLRALERIAECNEGRMKLLVDGGFRRGTDIVKALALGADAVMLGRAPLYGVAADGQSGAAGVLDILRDEMRRTLGLLGCTAPDQLMRSHLDVDS
ncbi:alpha-hydroxy acid oxidase [Caballeronia sp. LZ034LL]|uniref:alpha-hydroxy acid oxidase n=1 Tax=Caballeronia sp. LZ034LL TaxID=3038567 RepID=UPI00285FBDE3|nr:alpha-hydroxy acid oxidase [Caballeronia sp. LZ034LL]MDR5836050.1 alpha-hydroxy acid oxidase [Caballeronia sp. LZ034LL]